VPFTNGNVSKNKLASVTGGVNPGGWRVSTLPEWRYGRLLNSTVKVSPDVSRRVAAVVDHAPAQLSSPNRM
jgi:hypothetical protein